MVPANWTLTLLQYSADCARTAQRAQSANAAESPAKSRCAGIVRLPRAHEKTFACSASRDLVHCVISILGLVTVLATNYLGGAAGVSKPGFF